MNRAALIPCFICLVWSAGTPPTMAADSRPNILLLVSDDQRHDTIAALGNSIIETPSLDALVRGGTSFTRAFCGNPICTPSRAEILTGCSSFRNGVLDFGGKIDSELTLLPEVFRAAGYRTWYVGKWHNDGRPIDRGYDRTLGLFAGGGGRWAPVDAVDWRGLPVTGYRGWIFQNDEGRKFPDRGVGLTPDISARFADAAIELIRQPADRPFFLHVNFTAPHDPLLAPPGFDDHYPPESIPLPMNFAAEHPFDHGNLRGRDEKLVPFPRTEKLVREELSMYYRVISHLDREIGRILKSLEDTGQAENTIVVFTSDHGLAVGSHGLRGKQNMYEHTIRVPMIIRGPSVPRGKQRDAMVYLRDLYPTLCDLAGIEVPPSVESKSLAGIISGREEAVHRYVFGYFRNYQRMIRGDRFKLIMYPHLDRVQLFDIDSDPNEIHDLADVEKYAEIRNRLAREFSAWQCRVDDPLLGGATNGEDQ